MQPPIVAVGGDQRLVLRTAQCDGRKCHAAKCGKSQSKPGFRHPLSSSIRETTIQEAIVPRKWTPYRGGRRSRKKLSMQLKTIPWTLVTMALFCAAGQAQTPAPSEWLT